MESFYSHLQVRTPYIGIAYTPTTIEVVIKGQINGQINAIRNISICIWNASPTTEVDRARPTDGGEDSSSRTTFLILIHLLFRALSKQATAKHHRYTLPSDACIRPAPWRESQYINQLCLFSQTLPAPSRRTSVPQSAIVIAELNWALAWYALMRVFWMELRFLYVFFVVSSWPPWEATDYFWSQCPELLAWLAFVAFTSSYMGWQGRL